MFGIEKDFQNLMEQVYGPLNKNKMTEIDPSLILKSGDCIYYHGVKYQKVVEPKSFYNKLWDLLKTKLNNTLDCDELTDEVIDLIRDTIPEPMENKYHSDIIQGYNTAIKDIKERF
jgi:hypothetical protein